MNDLHTTTLRDAELFERARNEPARPDPADGVGTPEPWTFEQYAAWRDSLDPAQREKWCGYFERGAA